MIRDENTLLNHDFDLNSDASWQQLYPTLHAITRRLVYSFRVPSWYGQEEDIVEDVVQETMRRVIERLQKAEQGRATPVASPGYLMRSILRNYLIDLRRQEIHIIHIPSDNASYEVNASLQEFENVSEMATEHLYNEWLFLQVALQIAQMPPKLRSAILTDLANRMSFDKQLTPLQEAFLLVGIDLKDFRLPLPNNPTERTKRLSLVSIAYKRFARITAPDYGQIPSREMEQ